MLRNGIERISRHNVFKKRCVLKISAKPVTRGEWQNGAPWTHSPRLTLCIIIIALTRPRVGIAHVNDGYYRYRHYDCNYRVDVADRTPTGVHGVYARIARADDETIAIIRASPSRSACRRAAVHITSSAWKIHAHGDYPTTAKPACPLPNASFYYASAPAAIIIIKHRCLSPPRDDDLPGIPLNMTV